MAGLSSTNYPIARPTGVCASTGEVINPGDAFVAAVVEVDGPEGFERLDYSKAAWDGGTRPERLFGYWRSTMPEPNERRKVFIDDEALLDLFEQLGESEEPRRLSFRFVLSLILMRKKLLKHVGTRRAGDRSFMLVRRKGADPESAPIEVLDPGMDGDAIDDATEQLSLALAGEE